LATGKDARARYVVLKVPGPSARPPPAQTRSAERFGGPGRALTGRDRSPNRSGVRSIAERSLKTQQWVRPNWRPLAVPSPTGVGGTRWTPGQSGRVASDRLLGAARP